MQEKPSLSTLQITISNGDTQSILASFTPENEGDLLYPVTMFSCNRILDLSTLAASVMDEPIGSIRTESFELYDSFEKFGELHQEVMRFNASIEKIKHDDNAD